jgi:hypothetical protein
MAGDMYKYLKYESILLPNGNMIVVKCLVRLSHIRNMVFFWDAQTYPQFLDLLSHPIGFMYMRKTLRTLKNLPIGI